MHCVQYMKQVQLKNFNIYFAMLKQNIRLQEDTSAIYKFSEFNLSGLDAIG